MANSNSPRRFIPAKGVVIPDTYDDAPLVDYSKPIECCTGEPARVISANGVKIPENTWPVYFEERNQHTLMDARGNPYIKVMLQFGDEWRVRNKT